MSSDIFRAKVSIEWNDGKKRWDMYWRGNHIGEFAGCHEFHRFFNGLDRVGEHCFFITTERLLKKESE